MCVFTVEGNEMLQEKAKYWRASALSSTPSSSCSYIFFFSLLPRGVAGVRDNPVTGPAQTLALSHINISSSFSSPFFLFFARQHKGETEKWRKNGDIFFHSILLFPPPSPVPLSGRASTSWRHSYTSRYDTSSAFVVSLLEWCTEESRCSLSCLTGFGDILRHKNHGLQLMQFTRQCALLIKKCREKNMKQNDGGFANGESRSYYTVRYKVTSEK